MDQNSSQLSQTENDISEQSARFQQQSDAKETKVQIYVQEPSESESSSPKPTFKHRRHEEPRFGRQHEFFLTLGQENSHRQNDSLDSSINNNYRTVLREKRDSYVPPQELTMTNPTIIIGDSLQVTRECADDPHSDKDLLPVQ